MPKSRPLVAVESREAYAYPQHLREAIEDAPTSAGVYTFHGEAGDLPLYIGKSINFHKSTDHI